MAYDLNAKMGIPLLINHWVCWGGLITLSGYVILVNYIDLRHKHCDSLPICLTSSFSPIVSRMPLIQRASDSITYHISIFFPICYMYSERLQEQLQG